jgi:G3E family GTPase
VAAQVASADLVVQNKIDLVTADEAAGQRDALAALAPGARVLATAEGRLPADIVLGVTLASGGPRHAALSARPRHAGRGGHAGGAPSARAGRHGASSHASFATRTFTAGAPIDGALLRQALDTLPPAVLRAKGLVRLREAAGSVQLVQAVANRWTVAPFTGAAAEQSSLVVIGASGPLDCADLGPLAAAFADD